MISTLSNEFPKTRPAQIGTLKRLMFRFAALIVVVVGILIGMSAMAKKPQNLGAKNGLLAPLPDSPNCVSTQTNVATKRMAALAFTSTPEAAMDKLVKIVSESPRMKIVTRDKNYLHVEDRSLIFRFVDDIEFLVDEDKKVIDFRSASRAGHHDLGVNRRRMLRIQKRFEKN